MIRLSDAEMDCLRRVADEPSTTAPPCSDDVLKHLQDLGLIDFAPRVWVPLETLDVRYQLTEQGEDFLKRAVPTSGDDGGEREKK